MKNTKSNDATRIKTFLLAIGLVLIGVVVSCTSCTKQANTVQPTAAPAGTVTIEGKWYDPNNTSDWFTIQDTVKNNVQQYYMKHYKYSSCCPDMFVGITEITSAPGYWSAYGTNNSYQCYLTFIGSNMKVTGTASGLPNINVTYSKQ